MSPSLPLSPWRGRKPVPEAESGPGAERAELLKREAPEVVPPALKLCGGHRRPRLYRKADPSRAKLCDQISRSARQRLAGARQRAAFNGSIAAREARQVGRVRLVSIGNRSAAPAELTTAAPCQARRAAPEASR